MGFQVNTPLSPCSGWDELQRKTAGISGRYLTSQGTARWASPCVFKCHISFSVPTVMMAPARTLLLNFAPQVSVVVDGGKKTVEFSSKGLLKSTPRLTFKGRDLHALFDRQWHKLSISVQSNIVSIYMDCKLVERRLTEEKDNINPGGRTLITTRVEDGRPVDVRQSKLCWERFLFCLFDKSSLCHFRISSIYAVVLPRVPSFNQSCTIFTKILEMLSHRFQTRTTGAYLLNLCKSSIVSYVPRSFSENRQSAKKH